VHLVVLADRELMAARARLLNLPSRTFCVNGPRVRPFLPDHWIFCTFPCRLPLIQGQLDPANSRIRAAVFWIGQLAGCQSGEFAAMVTAPVHKGVINDAGIPFTGHTEYLAEKTHTPRVVMMFAGEAS
jgi:4-hydroxythreonine-4-phosphate dehydrogenase